MIVENNEQKCYTIVPIIIIGLLGACICNNKKSLL